MTAYQQGLRDFANMLPDNQVQVLYLACFNDDPRLSDGGDATVPFNSPASAQETPVACCLMAYPSFATEPDKYRTVVDLAVRAEVVYDQFADLVGPATARIVRDTWDDENVPRDDKLKAVLSAIRRRWKARTGRSISTNGEVA